MDIVVTYDVSDIASDSGRRLRAVAAICEQYGIRSQFSVFECRLSDTNLARLLAELHDAIDPTVDSVHVYRIGSTIESSRLTIGRSKHHPVNQPWII